MKEKLKEWMYLLYYFIKTLLWIEPFNLLKAIAKVIASFVAMVFSIFSKKEENRDYKSWLIILTIIEMFLIVARNSIRLRIGRYDLMYIVLGLIFLMYLLKIKKEEKWKHEYRKKYIYRFEKR